MPRLSGVLKGPILQNKVRVANRAVEGVSCRGDRTVKPDLATSRILLRMSPAGCVVNVFRLQGTQGVLRDGLYALLLMDLSLLVLIPHGYKYRVTLSIVVQKKIID